MKENNNFTQQGWECPKCGRVYSPYTSMCSYCGGEAVTYTTNTSPYIDQLITTKVSENKEDK